MNSYFLKQLDQEQKLRQSNKLKIPKIVIVGIGNELFGDDAAGVLILRRISQSIFDSEHIRLIEASIAPENFTGKIREYSPDWVWIFDAAEMGLNPGEIRILDMDQIEGISALSHQMPPTLFVKYVQMIKDTKIFFFGIQPKKISPYQEATIEIKIICEEIGDCLSNWILKNIK